MQYLVSGVGSCGTHGRVPPFSLGMVNTHREYKVEGLILCERIDLLGNAYPWVGPLCGVDLIMQALTSSRLTSSYIVTSRPDKKHPC